MSACVCVCVCVYVRVLLACVYGMCAYVLRAGVCVHEYVCACEWMHVYVCVFMHLCVYMCARVCFVFNNSQRRLRSKSII